MGLEQFLEFLAVPNGTNLAVSSHHYHLSLIESCQKREQYHSVLIDL